MTKKEERLYTSLLAQLILSEREEPSQRKYLLQVFTNIARRNGMDMKRFRMESIVRKIKEL